MYTKCYKSKILSIFAIVTYASKVTEILLTLPATEKIESTYIYDERFRKGICYRNENDGVGFI